MTSIHQITEKCKHPVQSADRAERAGTELVLRLPLTDNLNSAAVRLRKTCAHLRAVSVKAGGRGANSVEGLECPVSFGSRANRQLVLIHHMYLLSTWVEQGN